MIYEFLYFIKVLAQADSCFLFKFLPIFLLVITLLQWMHAGAQPRADVFLKKLLKREKDSLLQHVLSHPETLCYQLVYTQIERDGKNQPAFTNFYYQFDSLHYFNPASPVKLPLALLTLEKLHSLEKYGVDINTPVKIDSSYSGQTPMYEDSTSANGFHPWPTLLRRYFWLAIMLPTTGCMNFWDSGPSTGDYMPWHILICVSPDILFE